MCYCRATEGIFHVDQNSFSIKDVLCFLLQMADTLYIPRVPLPSLSLLLRGSMTTTPPLTWSASDPADCLTVDDFNSRE